MRRGFILMTLLLAGASAATAAASAQETRRLTDATRVLGEIRSAPDRNIPQDIWQRARCAAVIPRVKKAAFVVGGEYGRGVVSCRTSDGWSAPVFMTLEKGSVGVQFGAVSTDLVLLVMNDRGMDRLLQDKVTLGAEASVAAGPVGRAGAAATDAQLTAEILSYSHARGLFAGVDLSGGVLRADIGADKDLYGRTMTAREILRDTNHVRTPVAARSFVAALKGFSREASAKRGA